MLFLLCCGFAVCVCVAMVAGVVVRLFLSLVVIVLLSGVWFCRSEVV